MKSERDLGGHNPVLAVRERKHPGRRGWPEIEILTGQVPISPTTADLANEDLFTTFQSALKGRLTKRYSRLLPSVLPEIIGQEPIVTIVHRSPPLTPRYFVATGDRQKLLEAFNRSRAWLRQKLQEARGATQAEKRNPVGISGKLTPEKIDQAIARIKEIYGEGAAIFYSHYPHLRQLMEISRYTLSEILKLAQRNGVIPRPRRTTVPKGQHSMYWASHSREEVIAALEHLKDLKSQGEELFSVATLARDNTKVSARLTIKEAAQQLGLPIPVFHRLIVEGQISLGDSVLEETIRRVKNPNTNSQRLNGPAILEKPDLREAVERWKNRHGSFDSLTPGKLNRHRHLFATVWEAAKSAGLHPVAQRNDVVEIAQKLAEKGIDIKTIESRRKEMATGHYYVMQKKDLEEAVNILREDPDFAPFRQNPVVLVCGPLPDQLPNTTQLIKKRGFLSVGTFLAHNGIEVRGSNRITSIEDFFGVNSPISIFKTHANKYYFPASQKEVMEEFVERRKRELAGY